MAIVKADVGADVDADVDKPVDEHAPSMHALPSLLACAAAARSASRRSPPNHSSRVVTSVDSASAVGYATEPAAATTSPRLKASKEILAASAL